jgi:hypothetical protein
MYKVRGGGQKEKEGGSERGILLRQEDKEKSKGRRKK